jgi:hypothetical protein
MLKNYCPILVFYLFFPGKAIAKMDLTSELE